MALPVFPSSSLPGLTWPVKRAPSWQTIKQDALSGKRTRFALQAFPIWRYELSFSLLRAQAAYAEWQTLVGFYNSLYGGEGLFQFNDPNDGAVVAQQFGVGTGLTATVFQLVRSLGGFVEPVYLPNTSSGDVDLVNGNPVTLVDGVTPLTLTGGFHIYDNGTDVTANATVGNYGAVTFASIAPALGDALTWTGSFGWPCRFDDESMDLDNFMYQYWELKKLTFSSELLP
jgi:hypothetical protein